MCVYVYKIFNSCIYVHLRVCISALMYAFLYIEYRKTKMHKYMKVHKKIKIEIISIEQKINIM